jgi:hypothetical protein
MYLFFDKKNILVANNLSLTLCNIEDVFKNNKQHLFNKWEKIDNPDGSFYLSFVDYRKLRYYLQNSGNKDIVSVSLNKGETLLRKDNSFVYQGNYGISTRFTLNVADNYLSDINIITIKDLASTSVLLVDNLDVS